MALVWWPPKIWMETGIDRSAAVAHSGSYRSEKKLYSRVAGGELHIMAPRRPMSPQRLSSATPTSMSQVGIMAMPMIRSGSTAQNSPSQSLYTWMQASWSSTSSYCSSDRPAVGYTTSATVSSTHMSASRVTGSCPPVAPTQASGSAARAASTSWVEIPALRERVRFTPRPISGASKYQ